MQKSGYILIICEGYLQTICFDWYSCTVSSGQASPLN